MSHLKNLCAVSVLILLASLSALSGLKSQATVERLMTNEIKDTILSSITDFPESCLISIALVSGDRVEFAGFGDGEGYQNDGIAGVFFEIGSITKVMTSLVFAALVREGQVLEDMRASDVFEISFVDERVADITLLQLSNHTSGLLRMPADFVSKNPDDPYADIGLERLLESLSITKLVTPPGVQWAYSNFGAALLAQALVKITGQSYEDLLNTYVFDPGGMALSTARRENLKDALIAPARGFAGQPISYWSFDAYEGAGAVYSNAGEMAQFVQTNLRDTTYFQDIRLATFDVPRGGKIGKGILRAAGDQPVYWHNGGTGGFRSCMAFDTDKYTAVIILSNVSAFHRASGIIDQLCFKLLKALP